MQAELIEQRDALMKLRRPASRSRAFFRDLVLKRWHVGCCWGNAPEKRVGLLVLYVRPLGEATGGGINGSQHGIFARDLGACVPNVSSVRKIQQKQWSSLNLGHLYHRLFTGIRWSIGGRRTPLERGKPLNFK